MAEAKTFNPLFATILRSMDPTVDEQAKTAAITIQFEKPPIPDKFDPRDPKKSGGSGTGEWTDYLTPIYNQENCAGCYSFSTISCLSDRFTMQTLLQVKPFFNPLEPIMCYVESKNAKEYKKVRNDIYALQQEEALHVQKACRGNSLYSVGSYVFRAGAVENNCLPIDQLQQALDNTGRLPLCTNVEGPAQDLCLDNTVAQRLWPADEVYTLQGEGDELISNIKLEIMKWGPISVAFKVYPDFIRHYDGKSIYTPAPGQKALGGHAVKLVGWGQDGNTPYWICANSWGIDWGDNGYFRIVRGDKALELEQNHMCVSPLLAGDSQIPYTPTNTLITEDLIQRREYNAVDPVTFYPKRTLDLVKAGVLKGNLNPVISTTHLPLSTEFYAYQLGTNNSFMTFGGEWIYTYPSHIHSIKMNNLLLWPLILAGIVAIIVLSTLLWRCHHRSAL